MSRIIFSLIYRTDSGEYSLILENSAGSKTASVNVVVLDTPSAPRDLKANDVTKESVALTWNPPDNNGGSVISHYIVEKKESTKKSWSTVTMTCVRTSFKVIVTKIYANLIQQFDGFFK